MEQQRRTDFVYNSCSLKERGGRENTPPLLSPSGELSGPVSVGRRENRQKGKNGEKGVETKCFTLRMCKRRSLDGGFLSIHAPRHQICAPANVDAKGLQAEERNCE
ncbi:hypothetical protein CDAR_448941 [Caerostris darwini]|uniref:Uncharacterized protein n=1 Tax=Caerostris darwini TaxID=1538125 RepID=A0AAV4WAB4_9ARAC|nr:hypothetical protein CDAR_448941 [Caerostris darwini]